MGMKQAPLNYEALLRWSFTENSFLKLRVYVKARPVNMSDIRLYRNHKDNKNKLRSKDPYYVQWRV